MSYKLKDEHISLSSKNRLYEMKVPIIGLTGGIACGKSTVASIISEGFQIPIINADLLVKEAYKEDEVLIFLKENCPDSIINGEVDFSILRKWVFSQDKNRSSIESAIYKHLPKLFKKESLELNANLFIYDVPLLFEKNINPKVDLVICVSCEEQTQIDRIVKRDNCSVQIAKKIIDSQMDLKEKEKMSQIVFRNDFDLSTLKKEVNKKMNEILNS